MWVGMVCHVSVAPGHMCYNLIWSFCPAAESGV